MQGSDILTNAMIWRAIDNLAASKNISCSLMAQISRLDLTALNKSKRRGSDCRPHWMSVGSLVKIMNETDTSWIDFARYFPPEHGHR